MNSPFKCPTCKKPVAEPDKFDGKIVFPFCSERCKLVDLGRWLDGKYQIPVDADVDTADDDFTTSAFLVPSPVEYTGEGEMQKSAAQIGLSKQYFV